MKPVQSSEGLAATSLRDALDRTSINKDDIDGLIAGIGWPVGLNYDRLAEALGLDVQFVHESWAHGRFANPNLHLAAMAIKNGLADVIACISVASWAKKGRIGGPGSGEEFRAAGGPHGEAPHYGLAAPMSGAAMALQKYFSMYGGTQEEFATIALTQRKHAQLNEHAIMRSDLTIEDYLDAPEVISPLRRYDCSLVSDGAVAVIITSLERARDLCPVPVSMAGVQPMHAGRNNHSFALPGLGIFSQDEYKHHAQPHSLKMAGLSHGDLDGLGIYDAFAPQTLATLERFGFAPVGEGLKWIQDGRIELGGEMPVNTSGGHLSEAHIGGWGQIAEIIRQLQGVCGERQIKDAKAMMYAHSLGDATVFMRES